MKTKEMESRLLELYRNGRLQRRYTYELIPSDCSGSGYDIAYQSRRDESGDYVIDGILMRVVLEVKVGSTKWKDGIPAMYSLSVDPQSPYNLKRGERAIIVHRTGTKIGGSFMERKLASIAIERENGSLVYKGHTPYWISNTNTYASHYKSGFSKRDSTAYRNEVESLERIVNMINSTIK